MFIKIFLIEYYSYVKGSVLPSTQWRGAKQYENSNEQLDLEGGNRDYAVCASPELEEAPLVTVIRSTELGYVCIERVEAQG